jgi:hypothetical protein
MTIIFDVSQTHFSLASLQSLAFLSRHLVRARVRRRTLRAYSNNTLNANDVYYLYKIFFFYSAQSSPFSLVYVPFLCLCTKWVGREIASYSTYSWRSRRPRHYIRAEGRRSADPLLAHNIDLCTVIVIFVFFFLKQLNRTLHYRIITNRRRYIRTHCDHISVLEYGLKRRCLRRHFTSIGATARQL